MKILAWADVHFRDSGSFFPWNQITASGLTGELENTLHGCEFIRDQIVAQKPDIVIGLGDLFHLTEIIPTRTLFAASKGIGFITETCRQLGIPSYFVLGNHDILSEIHKIDTVSGIRAFDKVFVETEYLNLGDLRVAVIPYQQSGKASLALMDARNAADLVLTHLDFNGCRYDSGEISSSAIMPTLGIPVISGDIHVPQEVGDVTYIGSLVQNKFQFPDLEKVGGVVLWENGKITRIRNTGSKHYVRIYDRGPQTVIPGPRECVLQYVTKRTKEETDVFLKDYEYIYVKDTTKTDEIKITYTSFTITDPRTLMRQFVAEENPDALDQYDEILGEKGMVNATN